MVQEIGVYQDTFIPVFNELPEIENIPSILMQLSNNAGYKSNLQLAEHCHIRAKHDAEAVQCWLNEYQRSPQTYRNYQKEADRLMLWCICSRHKALSQLDREDIEAYLHFLDNPKPSEFWCARKGGKTAKRYSKNWKPFTGPLSPRSKAVAMAAIHSLFRYLVAAGYLIFNPFQLIRKVNLRHNEAHKLETLERILEPELWEALKQTIVELPENTPHELDEKARARFIFTAFFYLGLRAFELAQGHWGNFRCLQDRWWYITKGKGNKVRRIPVTHFLAEIRLFRTHLKLPSLPTPNETGPLIPSWRHNEGLSPRHLANIVKEIGRQTAEKFKLNENKYQKLLKLSPHWLRHQSSSAQAWAGMDKAHVQQNMGHSSLQTTEIYFHTLDNQRHEDMQKLIF
ncbi:MAG: Tyrosine recombinase XerC [Legionellaceae bacterium]